MIQCSRQLREIPDRTSSVALRISNRIEQLLTARRGGERVEDCRLSHASQYVFVQPKTMSNLVFTPDTGLEVHRVIGVYRYWNPSFNEA